jgi:hypothetical protein
MHHAIIFSVAQRLRFVEGSAIAHIVWVFKPVLFAQEGMSVHGLCRNPEPDATD